MTKSDRRHLPVVPDDFKSPDLPTGLFSSSQYNLYKKCGRAYYFKYVMGYKSPQKALPYKGIMVHKGAEFSLGKKIAKQPATLEEAKATVSDAFDAGKDEIESWDDDKTAGSAKDSVLELYTTYHKQALPLMNPREVEKPFAIKHGGTLPVIGFIDLIDTVKLFDDDMDPGVPIVADLKYSGTSWSQADADKDPQFTLYAIAERVDKIRVDNVVPLKKGPVVKQIASTRTVRDKEVLIEDYLETADMIKKGVFPMAPIDHWGCGPKWCDHWHRCRGRGLVDD